MTLCTLCARPFTHDNRQAAYCSERCRRRGVNGRRHVYGFPVWRTLLRDARAESWALRALYRAHGTIRCGPRRDWGET